MLPRNDNDDSRGIKPEEQQMTFEQAREWMSRHGEPNCCLCPAIDTESGAYEGWIACPESCCDRPDHAHPLRCDRARREHSST